MTSGLPASHQALVLENFETGFELQHVATPHPSDGSAIVRILAAAVLSYSREIYNGERHYPFPKPLVGGTSAIGRVAAVGPDATLLQPGQLVHVDTVIRSRDDPTALFLTAIHEGMSDGSRKLMRDVWRDGTYAEFVKMPLENCVPLDEARLCQSLGYTVQDLTYLCYLLVAYGGLRDIKVEPGETIIMSPATGGFGGAGVLVAVAMGARVIAMGRNEKELARLKERVLKGTPGANIETVKITGDEAADAAALQAFGTIDAILDLSPPAGSKSTHIKSALRALRYEGRVSLMGFAEFPNEQLFTILARNITFKGKLMYTRDDMLLFVKMLERGLFPKGKDLVDTKAFALKDWKEAFDVAAEHTGLGKSVVLTP